MKSKRKLNAANISRHEPLARALLGAAVLFGMVAWTRTGMACDLAIVLDHTGSMTQVRSSTNRTRCEDAAYYAEDIVNYYRCGAATCTATLDRAPVDFYIDGTTVDYANSGTFDVTYSNPNNHCDQAASKRVNVFIFNSATGTAGNPLVSITQSITGADAQGWITLSDNNAAGQVLQAIDQQKDSCANLTPLADAICELQIPTPLGDQSLASKKLKILTDSGENDSSGPCAGPESVATAIPFTAGSWESNVYLELAGNYKWTTDATVFQAAGSILSSNVIVGSNGIVTRVDPETKQVVPMALAQSGTPTPDVEVFVALSNATYGKAVVVNDDTPISPIVGPPSGQPVPAAPPWIVFGLGLTLAAAGFVVIGRQRTLAV